MGASRWYDFQVWRNRSYCVEVINGETETDETDPVVTVHSNGTGTAPVGTNNNINTEPDGAFLSRVCFQTDDTVVNQAEWTLDVKNNAPAAVGYQYLVRVVETTLFSSWFFQGGDYNSFVLMRNTTTSAVHFVINWYNPAGTQVGTSGLQTVNANAGVGINSKTFVPMPETNFNGTVEITHDGAPGALVGQMTSLSATTGLGFDAPLFVRDSWFAR
jgi:hypothetical protein